MAKTRSSNQEPTIKRRKGKEPTETSSQQPPKPPPPTQPLPYQKFVTQEAEERYNLIKGRVFNKERGINIDKCVKNRIFVEKIHEKGWDGIENKVTKESNASIALEFLANVYVEGDRGWHSEVRGKMVNYSKWAINRVLGLREVVNYDVKARKEVYDAFRSRGEWDSLLDGLMREGKGWIETFDRPQMINTVDLLPEYKAWASFIQTVIDQTFATAEMIRERVIILLSLISDEEIDVGELMAHSLHKLVRTDRNTLGHCCLINRLCQDAQVPFEPTDVTVRSLTFISDSLIEGFEKELERHERNATQQQQP